MPVALEARGLERGWYVIMAKDSLPGRPGQDPRLGGGKAAWRKGEDHRQGAGKQCCT